MKLIREMASVIFQADEIYRDPDKVLVVIPSKWDSFSQEEQMLLDRILQAVNLSLGVVRIITGTGFGSHDLLRFAPRGVLLFGSDTSFPLEPYTLERIEEVPMLKADALGQLDNEKKGRLWEAMQTMFGIA